MGSSVKKAARI